MRRLRRRRLLVRPDATAAHRGLGALHRAHAVYGHEAVPEGDAVGIEIEEENNIDLVLFSNIYWTDENLY